MRWGRSASKNDRRCAKYSNTYGTRTVCPGCVGIESTAFTRVAALPKGAAVEIDANHLTINTHPRTVEALRHVLPTG